MKNLASSVSFIKLIQLLARKFDDIANTFAKKNDIPDRSKILKLTATVEPNADIAFPIMRFQKCAITGITNAIKPSTGESLNFGILHFMGNLRPTSDMAPPSYGGKVLRFKIYVTNNDESGIVIDEDLSTTALRMMSFQGSMDYEARLDPIIGVYADVEISNPSDGTTGYLNLAISPAHIIQANKTYWIEFQAPIVWKWA